MTYQCRNSNDVLGMNHLNSHFRPCLCLQGCTDCDWNASFHTHMRPRANQANTWCFNCCLHIHAVLNMVQPHLQRRLQDAVTDPEGERWKSCSRAFTASSPPRSRRRSTSACLPSVQRATCCSPASGGHSSIEGSFDAIDACGGVAMHLIGDMHFAARYSDDVFARFGIRPAAAKSKRLTSSAR